MAVSIRYYRSLAAGKEVRTPLFRNSYVERVKSCPY